MTSVADILAARKPATRTARLVLDGEKAAELAGLRARLNTAKVRDRLNGGSLDAESPELERRIAELETEMESTAATFTFKAVGRRRLDEITNRFPPSQEQWERFRDSAKVNPFVSPPEFDMYAAAPEVLAAAAVSPTMTVEEAQLLWDELSDGEAGALWTAAWGVQMEATSRPTFGTGIDETANTGPGSTTPLNGESLSLSTPDVL